MGKSNHYLALVAVLAAGWMLPDAAGGRTARAARPTALAVAIAEIEAGRRTTPLIGDSAAGGEATVTFLAKRAGGRVPRIVSDVTGWGEHLDGTFDFTTGTMRRVGRTDWYALDAKVAACARIEYLIAYGRTDYRLDPHNPRQAAGRQRGGLPASEFVMPGYVPPEEFEDPAPSPCGLVTEGAVESQALGGSRRVSVYTPAGYRGDAGHPVLVLMDMRTRQVSRVLDRLIAHRSIEPVVAVFAEPQPRGGDYPEPSALRTFIADEVLAWLASKYGVAGPAGKRAIVGISYRAKDALDIAARSGAYDCLGLLIPGRRLGPADIQGLARLRERRLRVAILAGRYDQANVPTARHLRRALTDAGHEVDYTEVPEGHSATTWTSHLRTVLVSLFGRR